MYAHCQKYPGVHVHTQNFTLTIDILQNSLAQVPRWVVGLVQMGTCTVASAMAAWSRIHPASYHAIPYHLFMNLSSFR